MSDDNLEDYSAPVSGVYPDFQGPIDQALDKANPMASVPWPHLPAPVWAEGFRPRRIVDVGCAKAKFTSAVLTRLGQWGCLSEVSEVVLVDNDPTFGALGKGSVVGTIVDRCGAVLARYGNDRAKIRFIRATVSAEREQIDMQSSKLCLAQEFSFPVDLVIASHVTYYFRDSGRPLIEAIMSALSPRSGIAWVVARKKKAPIYRARESYLRHNSLDDPSAYDFAEYLEQMIVASLHGIVIIDKRDMNYLCPNQRVENLLNIISLLMWRKSIATCANGEIDSIFYALQNWSGPLFSESHYILGNASGSV